MKKSALVCVLAAMYASAGVSAFAGKSRHMLVACQSSANEYSTVLEYNETGYGSSVRREAMTFKVQKDGKTLFSMSDRYGQLVYSGLYGEVGELLGRVVRFAILERGTKYHGSLQLLDHGDSDYGPRGNNVNGILTIFADDGRPSDPLDPPQTQFGVSCAAVSNEL